MNKQENATVTENTKGRFVELEDILTLDEMYGCDPWDDENYGRHPASLDQEYLRRLL